MKIPKGLIFMYKDQKKNLRKALNEVLELGTDQSRIEYSKDTPGQSTEITKAVDYVEKPVAATPSYKALTRAVKEGKTPEEISQEFELPVSYVKVLTGLQEGFITPEQLAEKVKDKMEFMKKKKDKEEDDEGEEEEEDEEDDDDDDDEDKEDEEDNGEDRDEYNDKKMKKDGGNFEKRGDKEDDDKGGEEYEGEDGDKEGNVMKMDKSKDEVDTEPVLGSDEEEDDDKSKPSLKKYKKEKCCTKESFGEALKQVIHEPLAHKRDK